MQFCDIIDRHRNRGGEASDCQLKLNKARITLSFKVSQTDQQGSKIDPREGKKGRRKAREVGKELRKMEVEAKCAYERDELSGVWSTGLIAKRLKPYLRVLCLPPKGDPILVGQVFVAADRCMYRKRMQGIAPSKHESLRSSAALFPLLIAI